MTLDQADFEHLLQLRTGLRRFLRWSEEQSKAAGLTPAKHQLLLTIRGHPDPAGPTIGEIADYLVLRHHSAVGLIDRTVRDGLVTRNPDENSRSVVRVALTPERDRHAGRARRDSPSGTRPPRADDARAVADDRASGRERAAPGRTPHAGDRRDPVAARTQLLET